MAHDYPKATPPPEVVNGLNKSLPEGAVISHFISWRKGVGSLGRPRFAVIARWRGGHVVREAKALVPSAWDWAHGRLSARTRFLDLALGTFRSADPFLNVDEGFVFRRIAADSRKVELENDASMELRSDLFEAMGFDLAAIHAADLSVAAEIKADLRGRGDDWLYQAAKTTEAAVKGDFREWQK